ncbi:5867_t:CDS:2 [Funneliformis caledonium]|uniref:5867_t:CDS:1 n=1 Tax=Funneliformis caledonium TaxID=1117310 RepID=A0A9N9CLP7_9GLOM|nr:5867_t:CDS:2 [Funneliformis caledonium]
MRSKLNPAAYPCGSKFCETPSNNSASGIFITYIERLATLQGGKLLLLLLGSVCQTPIKLPEETSMFGVRTTGLDLCEVHSTIIVGYGVPTSFAIDTAGLPCICLRQCLS